MPWSGKEIGTSEGKGGRSEGKREDEAKDDIVNGINSHTEHPLDLHEVLNGMSAPDATWEEMMSEYVATPGAFLPMNILLCRVLSMRRVV